MSLKSQILFLLGVTCSSAFAIVIDVNQDNGVGMGLAMQACQRDLHTARQQRQQQMHQQDQILSDQIFPSHQPGSIHSGPEISPSAILPGVFPSQRGVPAGYQGTQMPDDYGYPSESEKFPGQP